MTNLVVLFFQYVGAGWSPGGAGMEPGRCRVGAGLEPGRSRGGAGVDPGIFRVRSGEEPGVSPGCAGGLNLHRLMLRLSAVEANTFQKSRFCVVWSVILPSKNSMNLAFKKGSNKSIFWRIFLKFDI